MSDDERDRRLAAARACVCPSTKEGWGLTVIEANALGTPVVATDAPGLRDSVDPDRTGFLVPDGDVDAFRASGRARCVAPRWAPQERYADLVEPDRVSVCPCVK